VSIGERDGRGDLPRPPQQVISPAAERAISVVAALVAGFGMVATAGIEIAGVVLRRAPAGSAELVGNLIPLMFAGTAWTVFVLQVRRRRWVAEDPATRAWMSWAAPRWSLLPSSRSGLPPMFGNLRTGLVLTATAGFYAGWLFAVSAFLPFDVGGPAVMRLFAGILLCFFSVQTGVALSTFTRFCSGGRSSAGPAGGG